MSAEANLQRLGIVLPAAPAGVGAYVPWVRVGNLLFTSGQLPWLDGKLSQIGKVGADVTLEGGFAAARQAAINAIAQLKAAVIDLENVVQIARVDGLVHSAPGFTDQAKVLNGASELLAEVFGSRGRHARLAHGVGEMPLGAAVQVALIAEVR